MATKTRRLADFLANIDDDSKVTSTGLLDATITAADLANDSVGADEIIDDAVTNAAIADGAIDTAAKLGSNVVTSAKIADANVTAGKLSSTALASVEHVKPHIQPGTLYPAWSGLLEDNTGFTFTDSSASGHTITVAGDVHHTGKQKKVGNTTLNFNGGHLNIPDSADWDMAGGEFTVEYWVRGDVTANKMHMGQDGSAGIIRSLVEAQSGTPKIVAYYYGSSAQALISTTTFAANTWYHVAIVRNNSGTDAVNLFINGTQEATIAPNANMANHSAVLSIGAFGTYVAQNHLGYMDEIRITKGLAVYTGNFTPQTTALTTTWSAGTNIAANSDASKVKLLIHSDAGGHSGAYGTAQSDGRSYYYTDIKGSKPIKDPRIGAHFGSQRHRISSMQIREQETATNGTNVYSVDGRGWIRAVDADGKWVAANDDNGQRLGSWANTSEIASIEIVGYFNDMTITGGCETTDRRSFVTSLNGSANSSENASYKTSANTPMSARYVDRTSLVNLNLPTTHSSTLGINTLKISNHANNDYLELSSIELIAQDTSNVNNIQIHAQNVVSYGKKFSVSAAAHHYDPFNGFTSGNLAAVQALIDKDTSLGMENWYVSGTTTYYRPFNGGRVVKWVDSSGTVKTSVTMMPPNAQNKDRLASAAIDLSASQVNNDIINFDTKPIDHSLSEEAKTFHFREFGNGSANQGHGGTRTDFSMMDQAGNQGQAYCMDDGLTAMQGDNLNTAIQSGRDKLTMHGSSARFWVTFIGTGISVHQRAGTHGGTDDIDWDVDGVEAASLLGSAGSVALSRDTVAQNLSYGTHIVKFDKNATNTMDPAYEEFTFYQPKMPPIPENAVVIADYMLVADHVTDANGSTQHLKRISKGVRRNNVARDIFYDLSSGSFAGYGVTRDEWHDSGFYVARSATTTADVMKAWLPAFATQVEAVGFGDRRQLYVDGGGAEAQSVSGASYGTKTKMNAADTLGVHTFKSHNKASTNGDLGAIDVVTPIHTSSHYQPFESHYLKELLGGDRNMEQTNLVVTADGKSWDEVTRDTSYISKNICLSSSHAAGSFTTDGIISPISNRFRGTQNVIGEKHNNYQKDWAIAYNRFICLVTGTYNIKFFWYHHGGYHALHLNKNATYSGTGYYPRSATGDETVNGDICDFFKRGDWFALDSRNDSTVDGAGRNLITIIRVE